MQGLDPQNTIDLVRLFCSCFLDQSFEDIYKRKVSRRIEYEMWTVAAKLKAVTRMGSWYVSTLGGCDLECLFF